MIEVDTESLMFWLSGFHVCKQDTTGPTPGKETSCSTMQLWLHR